MVRFGGASSLGGKTPMCFVLRFVRRDIPWKPGLRLKGLKSHLNRA